MDNEGTCLSFSFGDLAFAIETSATWTPEMVEDATNRMRRQMVAAARQLGLDQPLQAEGE